MNKEFTKQYFKNLFIGPELVVINRIIDAMKKVATNPNPEYWEENEILIRNTVKLAKRHYCGDEEEFLGIYTLNHLINNIWKTGEGLVDVFNKLHRFDDCYNIELIKFFQDDYYPGQYKKENCTNTYERTVWTRNQIAKLFEIYKLREAKSDMKKQKYARKEAHYEN